MAQQAADEPEGPIADVADVLTALSEQAARWQAELAKARVHVSSITEHRLSPGTKPAGSDWETTPLPEAAALLDGLLAGGARRVAHVHSGDARLLVPESRTIQHRELISCPIGTTYRTGVSGRHRIRGTSADMREMLLIDDSTALIPSRDSDDIAVVRQPLVVSQLIHFFDTAWLQSTPFDESTPAHVPGARAEAELKRRIILLLADGAKDEAMARRLGISLRTCRRHVAELLEQLDASSRFQAGARAALLGMLPAATSSRPSTRH